MLDSSGMGMRKEGRQFAAHEGMRPIRGGRARVLTDEQLAKCRLHIRHASGSPDSDELKLLLSHLAGLRSAEISALKVDAFLDPDGRLTKAVTIEARYSKSKRSRTIPLHPQLREAFERYRRAYPSATHVTFNKKCRVFVPQTPNTLAQWFRRLYREVGLEGCSSHSGRRSFITKLSKRANAYGNSLRDVQYLAGHARLDTTECYIDLSEDMTDLVASLGDNLRKRK